jgi:hypothetical protein
VTSNRSTAGTRAGAALLAALAALAIAGCGSEEEGTDSERPPGITDQQARASDLGTPQDKLQQRFDQEPILTSGPQKGAPRGCVYYAMRDRPLVDVWQFCFNARGQTKQIASLFGAGKPPEDASPDHQAMIGRADVSCQAANNDLRKLGKDLSRTLAVFGANPSEQTREAAAVQMQKFVDLIEQNIHEIRRFDFPDEDRETLEAYLDSLQKQADTLADARQAFLDDEINTYDKLGDEFTSIGETAKQQAEQYGLSVCSASSFG